MDGTSDRSVKRDEECLKERIVNDLDSLPLPTPDSLAESVSPSTRSPCLASYILRRNTEIRNSS